MKSIYTAILGSMYDDLKEPTVITPGWKYICYTDQELTSNVWEIRKIPPCNDPQRKAREIKILFHNYTDTEESIWIDAAFHIKVNLEGVWHYFKEPLSAPRHPLRHCVYQEIASCIVNQRGDAAELLAQEKEYRALGVPQFADNIISSGLLLRNKNAVPLCEAWWQEMQGRSVRDQVAFARVCGEFTWHKFNWDYSRSPMLVYKQHIKYRQG